ncbi:MAG: hypothetical protein JXR37_03080 [Kiritimatiellae bacterium]|nr:hypothetical protein [Kiritimatiellia bacterium]
MNAAGPMTISGVIPSLAIRADLGPPRTECAVGALMPWADRLWVVSYFSSGKGSGVGGGLYEIGEDLRMVRRPESRPGTYANRMVHVPSNQLIIGPYVIDADRKVRKVEALEAFEKDLLVCATMSHLTDPDHWVYLLDMYGRFLEMNVDTLDVRAVADLADELEVPDKRYAHFKAGYTAFGRVVVANNSYGQEDFTGRQAAGRLAEWDGARWTTLERNPFVEVTGRGHFGSTVFATGWDRASAILKVFTKGDGKWSTYRLPKASHTYDQMWQTEWPRIRETEHERFLMDCHGMFYELSPWAYEGRIWGVRPISTHLWVLGDFCSYRGMLVLGADNASPAGKSNPFCGEPQSGLWFGKTDDLWQFGKPGGWGGPWWEAAVQAGEPSDPYLMTGFDKKVVHLAHDADAAVTFTVEADFLGNGTWKTYGVFTVSAKGYVHHEFPSGYSAHWVRVTADRACRATAYFTYT